MNSVVSILSSFTRKYPKLVDRVRSILPLMLKRKLGSLLLPNNSAGTINSNDGREFYMISDRLFLQVVYDGIFEPSLSNFIESVVQENDICVDVGSNFGWFATLMAEKSKKVFAFEPAKRISKILKRNVALNKQSDIIEIKELAVGNETGTVDFVIEGDAERESALGYVGSSKKENDNVETVKIVLLDNELDNYKNKIALIKMDAEGYEHFAFQGAKKLLTCDHPPIIITEANEETASRSGTSRASLCKELTELGYKLYGITADGKLYKDDKNAPALAGIPPKGEFVKRIKEDLYRSS